MGAIVVTAQAPPADERLIEVCNGRFYTEKYMLQNWHTIFPKLLEYYGFKSYGANQSQIFIRAGNEDNANVSKNDSGRKGESRLDGMFKNSPAVRERRVYGGSEQIKRYLRHCAAALTRYYQIPGEVQCYYSDNIVYVATNSESDEKALEAIDKNRVWNHKSYQDYTESIIQRASDQPQTVRLADGSCQKSLSKRKAAAVESRMRHCVPCPDALKSATFRVVKSRNTDMGRAIPGLHAERKILYYLRGVKGEDYFLNPLCLGGMRRPCFVCAALCFESMNRVHRGVVWVSEAASKPKDGKEMDRILAAVRDASNLTHVSRRNDSVTYDNDTESCEENE
ncbi:MAG: hypothetical protein NC079_06405 [Clostridium sp.]|nr:hypothetical protein [Clostridium sp.]